MVFIGPETLLTAEKTTYFEQDDGWKGQSQAVSGFYDNFLNCVSVPISSDFRRVS
jgi:hypothetical protein